MLNIISFDQTIPDHVSQMIIITVYFDVVVYSKWDLLATNYIKRRPKYLKKLNLRNPKLEILRKFPKHGNKKITRRKEVYSSIIIIPLTKLV
jgi:hypothetical protein